MSYGMGGLLRTKFGVHHAARLEDWPVMPVAYAGFMLLPNSSFERSPALDVPPPSASPSSTNAPERINCSAWH